MARFATPTRAEGEPAWEIAQLFPNQGHWDEQEYLALGGNRLVEFSDGFVEVLPMPTLSHQLIMAFLYRALLDHVNHYDLGTVLFAPYRIRLRRNKYREPDVIFLARERADRIGETYAEGADLVMEVVSEDDPARDLETKRAEYAEAGIPEYWIIDPREGRILVLTLEPGAPAYSEHGVFTRGSQATSRLLPGLAIEVDDALAARR